MMSANDTELDTIPTGEDTFPSDDASDDFSFDEEDDGPQWKNGRETSEGNDAKKIQHVMADTDFAKIKQEHEEEMRFQLDINRKYCDRLKRRANLIAEIRKAYLRDIVCLKHVINEHLSKDEREEVVHTWKKMIPSIDIRQHLMLYGPAEASFDTIPCESCGGSVELVHHDSSEIEELSKALSHMDKNKDELRLLIATRGAQLDSAQKKLQKLESSHKEEKNVLYAEMRQMKIRNEEVHKDNIHLTNQLRTVRDDLVDARVKEQQFDKVSASLAETKALLQEANKNVQNMEDATGKSKETISVLMEQLDTVTAEKELAEEDITKQAAHIKAISNVSSKHKQNSDTFSKRALQLEKLLGESRKEVESLNARVQELESSLSEQNEEMSGEIEGLEAMLDTAREEASTLNESLQEVQYNLSTKTAEKENLQSAYNELHFSKEETVERLESLVARLKEQATRAEEELLTKTAGYDQVEADMLSYKEKAERFEADSTELTTLKKDFEKMKKDYDKMKDADRERRRKVREDKAKEKEAEKKRLADLAARPPPLSPEQKKERRKNSNVELSAKGKKDKVRRDEAVKAFEEHVSEGGVVEQPKYVPHKRQRGKCRSSSRKSSVAEGAEGTSRLSTPEGSHSHSHNHSHSHGHTGSRTVLSVESPAKGRMQSPQTRVIVSPLLSRPGSPDGMLFPPPGEEGDAVLSPVLSFLRDKPQQMPVLFAEEDAMEEELIEKQEEEQEKDHVEEQEHNQIQERVEEEGTGGSGAEDDKGEDDQGEEEEEGEGAVLSSGGAPLRSGSLGSLGSISVGSSVCNYDFGTGQLITKRLKKTIKKLMKEKDLASDIGLSEDFAEGVLSVLVKADQNEEDEERSERSRNNSEELSSVVTGNMTNVLEHQSSEEMSMCSDINCDHHDLESELDVETAKIFGTALKDVHFALQTRLNAKESEVAIDLLAPKLMQMSSIAAKSQIGLWKAMKSTKQQTDFICKLAATCEKMIPFWGSDPTGMDADDMAHLHSKLSQHGHFDQFREKWMTAVNLDANMMKKLSEKEWSEHLSLFVDVPSCSHFDYDEDREDSFDAALNSMLVMENFTEKMSGGVESLLTRVFLDWSTGKMNFLDGGGYGSGGGGGGDAALTQMSAQLASLKSDLDFLKYTHENLKEEKEALAKNMALIEPDALRCQELSVRSTQQANDLLALDTELIDLKEKHSNLSLSNKKLIKDHDKAKELIEKQQLELRVTHDAMTGVQAALDHRNGIQEAMQDELDAAREKERIRLFELVHSEMQTDPFIVDVGCQTEFIVPPLSLHHSMSTSISRTTPASSKRAFYPVVTAGGPSKGFAASLHDEFQLPVPEQHGFSRDDSSTSPMSFQHGRSNSPGQNDADTSDFLADHVSAASNLTMSLDDGTANSIIDGTEFLEERSVLTPILTHHDSGLFCASSSRPGSKASSKRNFNESLKMLNKTSKHSMSSLGTGSQHSSAVPSPQPLSGKLSPIKYVKQISGQVWGKSDTIRMHPRHLSRSESSQIISGMLEAHRQNQAPPYRKNLTSS